MKNIPSDYDETKVKNLFSEFGEIESILIPKDDKGENKDFCYVCYKQSEDAEKAVDQMNKKPLENGQFLIVNPFVSKKENEL